jgi:hypothetical protein
MEEFVVGRIYSLFYCKLTYSVMLYEKNTKQPDHNIVLSCMYPKLNMAWASACMYASAARS